MPKKLLQSEWHNSQRGWFAGTLYNHMLEDKDIVVVTADLGYGLFDKIRDNFPDRFYNVGAAEQAAAGICVGFALEGKKPFFYSITSFLLYRCFETIRNYIDHEQIPVRLCASGRDKDYHIDGFSHDATDAKSILKNTFRNINTFWPETKEQIPELVEIMINDASPYFISLRR